MTRSRDSLGRPLQPGDSRAVAGVSPDLVLDDQQAWALTVDYLAKDMPFHAHEVCELRWRQCPASERAVWQGLAQWGAALTHLARGYPERATRVATKALATLDKVAHLPECIDISRVRQSCRSLIP